MNRTTVHHVTFGDSPAWELECEGTRAVVAARGATLVHWDPGTGSSVIDGYRDDTELLSGDGSRSAILGPFPGRIDGGRFSFDGVDVSLPTHSDGHARHGFITDLDFELVSQSHSLHLRSRFDGDSTWPWSFVIDVVYSLVVSNTKEARLSVSISLKNTSLSDAPVGLGWHPLLSMPGHDTIRDLSLTIPARIEVATRQDRIPLVGERAFNGIHTPVVIDYVGDRLIDTPYTGLVPNEEGVVETIISNPLNGAQLSLTQEPGESKVVVVWTSDTMDRDPRGSIALEPYTFIPNAFNRADHHGSIRLASQATRTMTATLTYRP